MIRFHAPPADPPDATRCSAEGLRCRYLLSKGDLPRGLVLTDYCKAYLQPLRNGSDGEALRCEECLKAPEWAVPGNERPADLEEALDDLLDAARGYLKRCAPGDAATCHRDLAEALGCVNDCPPHAPQVLGWADCLARVRRLVAENDELHFERDYYRRLLLRIQERLAEVKEKLEAV